MLWLLLAAWACSLLLGAAVAWRIDARSSTLRQLDASGELKTLSDRQIDEKTRNAERVAIVLSVAKGAVGPPLQLGLGACALLGLCWFLRGRIVGRAVGPVAAASLLPEAIADLLDAVSAFRHAAIAPEGVTLAPRSLAAVAAAAGHPLAGPWLKLGNAFDFFSLWTALLLGFGLAAAGQLGRGKALAVTLLAWVCYRLLTHVAAGG